MEDYFILLKAAIFNVVRFHNLMFTLDDNL